MTRRTIIFGITGWVKLVTLYLGGGGGGGWGGQRDWGRGCVKITLLVSCLQWLTCSFVFIMAEFEKVLYSPDLKMVLIFFVTKVSQKGTMFK